MPAPLSLAFEKQPWTADALCRGLSPDLFHPKRGDTTTYRTAMAVCAECDVRAECLAYAQDLGPYRAFGVWGGTSEQERRRMKRRNKPMTETETNDADTTEPASDADGTDAEPTTFDAAYVGKLRAEAADRRAAARDAEARADQLGERLLAVEIERSTAGVLADPADLLVYTDASALVGDDGLPDRADIREAADALVAAKPHLGSRTPIGDIDQGATGRPVESFDLSQILRRAAG